MVAVRIVEFIGRGPGTRHSGAKVRAALEPEAAHGGNCALDFAEVDTVTHSFADEVIGVLVRARGPDLLDRLTFLNCSPVVRDTLQFVADYSAHFWTTGTFPTPTST